jgi:hypothetical protein
MVMQRVLACLLACLALHQVLELRLLMTPVNARGDTPADLAGPSGVAQAAGAGLMNVRPSMSMRLHVAALDIQKMRDAKLLSLARTPLWARLALYAAWAGLLVMGLTSTEAMLWGMRAWALSRAASLYVLLGTGPVRLFAHVMLVLMSFWHVLVGVCGCTSLGDYRHQVRPQMLADETSPSYF